MVFVLNATPAVSTLISPVEILFTSTTTKQTWNALTLSALVSGQEVKGDGFTNTTIQGSINVAIAIQFLSLQLPFKEAGRVGRPRKHWFRLTLPLMPGTCGTSTKNPTTDSLSLMALNLIGFACGQNSIYTTYSKLKCTLQHPCPGNPCPRACCKTLKLMSWTLR